MAKVQFDEQIAARYDETSADMYRPEVLEPVVDFLQELAGDGAALEFGIGTGRVALLLSGRGVPVHGIDISEPMLEQLRGKPGSEQIPVTVGDFASTRVDGRFQLAYLVFNTITNLTTQDEQVSCFRNAAAHLEPGGCFVIEVFVPELRRVPPGERVRAFDVRPTSASTSTRISRVRSSTRTTTGSTKATPGPSLRPTATSGLRSST